MQPRASVGLTDAQGTCELAVGELAVELQQHELALAQRQGRERISHGRAPLHVLEDVMRGPRLRAFLDEVVAASAPLSTQLIESGVARDREQPRTRRPAAMERAIASESTGWTPMFSNIAGNARFIARRFSRT